VDSSDSNSSSDDSSSSNQENLGQVIFKQPELIKKTFDEAIIQGIKISLKDKLRMADKEQLQ